MIAGSAEPRQLLSFLAGPRQTLRLGHLAIHRPIEEAEDSLAVERHIGSLAGFPVEEVRPPIEPLPHGVLMLTNVPREKLGPLPDDAIVVSDGGPVPADLTERRPRHVRVLVDLSGPSLSVPVPSDRVAGTLRLHERMFLLAKEAAAWFDGDSSFLVTILGGVSGDAVPTPFAGLFTGFAKSLAQEFAPAPVVATVHSAAEPAAALVASAAELSRRQMAPAVYFAGDRRLTPRTIRAKPRPSVPPLRENALVVAAGGGHGIGAPILMALAERFSPRIVVLGSTPLDQYEPGALEVDPAAASRERAQFIKALVSGEEQLSVAEANARFDRLQSARAVNQTLNELRKRCGPDKVGYRRCDLRDATMVQDTLHAVLAEDGEIDLLMNVAGLNRATSVAAKTLEDFLTVRDLKVRSYLNLKAALTARPPRRWCNFGSFIGFTGAPGETDYCSANDFLSSAAAWAAAHDEIEFTLGWGLWRDTGMGANPVIRSFVTKADTLTPTPTAEGVAHFLAELGQPVPPANTMFFGDKERAAIKAAAPLFLEWCDRPFPFIDRVLREGDAVLIAERTFDLERDGYLESHVVNGYPTLPGSFVPELAAEVAKYLVPHRIPAVFEDLRFESFLRVYRNERPQPKNIHARLARADENESVVHVRVLGDVYGPGGRLLAKDRLHFSVTVRMRDSYETIPRWAHWDDSGTLPVPDPYHAPNSPILLTSGFVSTSRTRLHPRGRRAALSLDPAEIDKWFADLRTPAVAIDGLTRLAVLDLIEDRWTPLAVPRSIHRIRLFSPWNDLDLLGRTVELYSSANRTPGKDPGADNVGIAATEDGRVLLEIDSGSSHIVGYLDQKMGAFVPPERVTGRGRS